MVIHLLIPLLIFIYLKNICIFARVYIQNIQIYRQMSKSVKIQL
jgi:hypothetical protein